MPLAGGASDKLGNYYELLWTVLNLLKVLDEKIDSIQIEAFGKKSEGSEFILKKEGVSEYHQVKRQNSNNYWRISDLEKEEIFKHSFEKTSGNDHYIFVSEFGSGQLKELGERARLSNNFNEFRLVFLNSNKDIKNLWHTLCDKWNQYSEPSFKLSEEDVYSRLQRFYIRTIDEISLEESLKYKISSLFIEDSPVVLGQFSLFIRQQIHKITTSSEILNYINSQKIKFLNYAHDRHVHETVRQCNKRFSSFFQTFDADITIENKVVKDIVSSLKSNDKKNSVLLTGEAGIGKTFALGKVIEKLSDSVKYLYFRVDQLEYTLSTKEVGRQLNLPDSPARTLEGISGGKTAILIIDQLDAVSVVSGRNPAFFLVIRNIIDEALASPNIRILIACRKFDLEKDNRFRELVGPDGCAVEMIAKKFSLEEVNLILDHLEYKADEKQKEVLQLPLNLRLLIELTDDQSTIMTWSTEQELFEKYWDQKKLKIAQSTDKWNDCVDMLVDKITISQQLSVPMMQLDTFEDTINRMVSENFLVKDEDRISFFHEKLFDYTVARRFVARNVNIKDFLKEKGQNLFHRALLRQVLFYLYKDKNSFIQTVEELIFDDSIRFHIKETIFGVLSQIDKIDETMWSFLDSHLQGKKYGNRFERVLYSLNKSESSWFRFIYKNRIIHEWLISSDSNVRQRAVYICQSQVDIFPEDICFILTSIFEISSKRDDIILSILTVLPRKSILVFFELFLKLYQRLPDDKTKELSSKFIFHNAEVLSIERKLFFIRLLIKRVMENIDWDSSGRELAPRGREEEDFIIKIAEETNGNDIIELLFPFFLLAVQKKATRFPDETGKIWIDPFWSFRFYGGRGYNWADAILLAIQTAMEKLPKEDETKFLSYLTGLTESKTEYGDYDSINFVLMHGLMGIEKTQIDLFNRGVEYICNNPERLECGWSSGGGGDLNYWASYQAVVNISRYCSDVRYEQLENCILNHTTRFEKMKDGFKSKGYFHHILLGALSPDRMSQRAKIKKQKVDEVFKQPITAPEPMFFESVPSPISESAFSKMTDAQWIGAMKKYNLDFSESLGGDSFQLSCDLQKMVAEQTERFCSLALKFDESINFHYYNAVMLGIDKGNAPIEIVFNVIRSFFQKPSKPGMRYLHITLSKYKNMNIPNDILEIIGWCATQADDPEEDVLTTYNTQDLKPENNPHNYMQSSINSVRGAAIIFIGELILMKRERAEFFKPFFDIFTGDRSTSVRVAAVYAVLAFYNFNRNLSFEYFLRICHKSKDVLLGTAYVDSYLYYITQSYPRGLKKIYIRMLKSEIGEVRKIAGKNILIGMYAGKKMDRLIKLCKRNDESMLGIVLTAKRNFTHKNPKVREQSQAILIEAFYHENKKIREESAHSFWGLKGRDFEKCKEVILPFIESRAFHEHSNTFIRALTESTIDLTEETLTACERFYEFNDMNDSGYSSSGMSDLILRVYRQVKGDQQLENRCLTIIDNLMEFGDYDIRREIAEFDR